MESDDKFVWTDEDVVVDPPEEPNEPRQSTTSELATETAPPAGARDSKEIER